MATSYFFQTIDAKLNRVPEKIEAIKAYSDAYIAQNPPQIIIDTNAKTTLDMPVPVPVDIPILIGEVLYQLRSTLDHLAFHLVKLNPSGATLPVEWEEHCQFPLLLEPPKGQTPPLPLGHFKNLPSISAKAHAFIEKVQPYYGVGKVNNCLRFLKELCNRDKHRYLVLTRSRSQVHETRAWGNRLITSGYRSRDHGEEIGLLDKSIGGDSNMLTSFRLSGFVAFNEPILGEASNVCIEEPFEMAFRIGARGYCSRIQAAYRESIEVSDSCNSRTTRPTIPRSVGT